MFEVLEVRSQTRYDFPRKVIPIEKLASNKGFLEKVEKKYQFPPVKVVKAEDEEESIKEITWGQGTVHIENQDKDILDLTIRRDGLYAYLTGETHDCEVLLNEVLSIIGEVRELSTNEIQKGHSSYVKAKVGFRTDKLLDEGLIQFLDSLRGHIETTNVAFEIHPVSVQVAFIGKPRGSGESLSMRELTKLRRKMANPPSLKIGVESAEEFENGILNVSAIDVDSITLKERLKTLVERQAS